MLRPRLLRELTLEPAAGQPSHVSAASGIVVLGEHFYVVADDEAAIGRWPLRGDAPGRLIAVFDDALPEGAAARKAAKPDLEALARVPGGLLAVGSGSSPRRRRGVMWPVERGEKPRAGDLTGLYAAIERALGVAPNVEGATVQDEDLLLAHRGIGRGQRSAIVRVALRPVIRAFAGGAPVPADGIRSVELHDPGELDGVPLGITDISALSGGRILYTAAAEDTADAVRDGQVSGSVIGILGEGPPRRVEGPAKIEGVAPRERHGGVDLLLVADPADRAKPAPLLAARLE